MNDDLKTYQRPDWPKYIVVFFITVLLFITALYFSNFLGNKKLDSIRAIQDQVATDILSSETRFALLEESSCSHLVEDAVLTEELGLLGRRLETMEEQLGTENKDVIQLKKYYSLLEIKDYLLTKALAEKCGTDPTAVLYFYTNDCSDCRQQGFVLTGLRDEYAKLRIYSFDAELESSAVQTLASISDIDRSALPALVINGITYQGFRSFDELKSMIPTIEDLRGEENATLELQTHTTSPMQ